jgi:hypothetical protein
MAPRLSLFPGSAGSKVFLLITIACNYYSYSHTLTIPKLLIYTLATATASNHAGYVSLLVVILFWQFVPILFHTVAES